MSIERQNSNLEMISPEILNFVISELINSNPKIPLILKQSNKSQVIQKDSTPKPN